MGIRENYSAYVVVVVFLWGRDSYMSLGTPYQNSRRGGRQISERTRVKVI